MSEAKVMVNELFTGDGTPKIEAIKFPSGSVSWVVQAYCWIIQCDTLEEGLSKLGRYLDENKEVSKALEEFKRG